MAEFPIFEGGGGNGQTKQATVRTSRIGPEPPEPEGITEAGKAAGQVGEIIQKQHNAQQQLLLGTYHAGVESSVAAYQAHAEDKGFDGEWQANYQKAVGDAQNHFAQILSDQGADPGTIKRAKNMTDMYAAGKLPEIGAQQSRLLHEQNLNILKGYLDNSVRHSLVSGEPLQQIKDSTDLIDQKVADGTLKPGEGYTMKLGYMKQMAEAHADHDIASNPLQAMRTFKDPATTENDPIYAWMTPQEKHQSYSQAVQEINRKEAQSVQWVKQRKDDALNTIKPMLDGSAPVDQNLVDKFSREGLIDKGLYYSLTGKTAPGDAGARNEAIDQMTQAASNNDEVGIDAAYTGAAGNDELNSEDRATLARTRMTLMTGMKQHIKTVDAQVASTLHSMPSLTLHNLTGADVSSRQFGTMYNKVKPGLLAIQQRYDDLIKGTDDPAKKMQLIGEAQQETNEFIKNAIDKGSIHTYTPSVATPKTIEAITAPSATPSPTPGLGGVAPMGEDTKGAAGGFPSSMPVPTGTPTPGPMATSMPDMPGPAMSGAEKKPMTLREFRDMAYRRGAGG